MKNLNFLPLEINQRRQVELDQWLCLSWAIACGAVIFAGVLWQTVARIKWRSEQERLAPLLAAARQFEQQRQQLLQESQQYRRRADLLALLDASWPPSKLLATIWQACPDSLQLTSVRLYRETRVAPQQAASATLQAAAPNPSSQDPVETAFQKVWQSLQETRYRIELQGTTSDPSALHPFLAQIQQCPLFASAKLESLAAETKNSDGRLGFSVRVEVQPAYQFPFRHPTPDGPAPSQPPSTPESKTAEGVPPDWLDGDLLAVSKETTQ
ncbi:MAG: hypothetical protein KatS3mg110_0539 [Pirellulaceae bacterium]|nr:MAG: hypothetical protein KatS3mg110_0539 [Pirellulaceae bacterium]